jgi:tetratricopeptide (TPR) repeat protein
VEKKAVFTHRYCRPNENNNAIFLCSGPRRALRDYWIVAHRMSPAFEEVLRTWGVDEAVQYYHQRKSQDSTLLLFTEQQMNRTGYGYLARGQVREAMVLFALNIEVNPGSFNVYDSYGEALMADHQYERAVENYRRSVALNPGNANGRKKLEELRLLMHARQSPNSSVPGVAQ